VHGNQTAISLPQADNYLPPGVFVDILLFYPYSNIPFAHLIAIKFRRHHYTVNLTIRIINGILMLYVFTADIIKVLFFKKTAI
jgi:hypothetical protein